MLVLVLVLRGKEEEEVLTGQVGRAGARDGSSEGRV